jgi:hypothetical protein
MGTGKSTVLVSNASEQRKNFGLEKPAEVQIPFAISVTGQEVPQSEFRVFIERAVESPNAPLPSPYIMDIHMNSGDEDFSFGKMQFLSEGEYHYRVRQEQRNHEGFTYDTTVYTVIVEVHSKNKDYNGNEVSPYLYAIVLAEREGDEDKSSRLLFKNSYQREPSTPSNIPGPKGGNGNPPRSPSGNPPDPPGVLGVGREILKPVAGLISQLPTVLGVARKIATGDDSDMVFYGLSALLAMGSFGFWTYQMKRRNEDDESPETEE